MSLMRAMSSSFGARLLMAALNYGLFWVLAHRLAGAELGGFSLLMNVFYLLQTLPLLGLSTPLTRRIATAPERLAVEISTALTVALPVAAALALLCGLTGQLNYPEFMHLPFWLLAASVLPSGWILVAEVSLIGLERMSTVARVQALEALVRTIASVGVVLFGGDLSALFGVFLAGRILTALIYFYRADLPRPTLSTVDPALQRTNRSDIPVFLGIGVLAAVAGRIDLIVLSRLGSLEDAGLYAAASRLYEAALMLPTVAAMVILPSLARLYQSDRQHFAEVLARSLRVCLAVGLGIALVVAALAQPLIDLLYAPHLHDAGTLLRWLIFGAVLMTLDQMLSSTMMAAHAQNADLHTLIVAVVTLAVLLLIGIPWWGPLGAAVAVPGALLVRVGWRLRWLMRHHPAPGLSSYLLRTTVAAAGALAVLELTLSQGALWTLLATVCTYPALAFLLGVLQPRHMHQIFPWMQRIKTRFVD